jgi:hypothetical protein
MADYKIDPGLVCPIEASHANLFIEDRSVEVRHMNWLYNTRKQEQVAGEVRVVKKQVRGEEQSDYYFYLTTNRSDQVAEKHADTQPRGA